MTRPWHFISIKSLSLIKSRRWFAICWDGAEIAKIANLLHEEDPFTKDEAGVNARFMNRWREANVT